MIKLKNVSVYISWNFIFDFVKCLFELLKWLIITGAITIVAERTQDRIVLYIMYLTYFSLYIYYWKNVGIHEQLISQKLFLRDI